MTKKITVKELLEQMENQRKLAEGKFIKPINYTDFDRILDIELRTFNPDRYDTLIAKAQYIISGIRDIDQLDYLKSILPLSEIDRADDTPGRIKEYTALSHHIWVTDIDTTTNDDIKVYKGGKHTRGTTEALKRLTSIDDEDNFFIKSCSNLSKGAISSKIPLSEDTFYHVIWTNLSRDEVLVHPELKSFRKIYKIDQSQIDLPNFLVLNINDVMDKDISEIKDQANPERPLPKSVLRGLAETKQDFLSVRSYINDMNKKHLFASSSDVIRAIAMKDMGGLYFDFDQEIFDQDKIHLEDKKYNLFDLMKNYNVILGKEFYDFCTNCFMSSAMPNSPVMNENLNMIIRNISKPNEIEYIKYSSDGGAKVILQTGPTPITLAFIKQFSDEDFIVPPGKLIHDSDFAYSRGINCTENDIGHLGGTISSSTWAENAKNLSNDYLMYDIETGRGITATEWAEMI